MALLARRLQPPKSRLKSAAMSNQICGQSSRLLSTVLLPKNALFKKETGDDERSLPTSIVSNDAVPS